MENKIEVKENPKSNYTGHGWEGKNYESGKSLTDIAKQIKQKLKEKYPVCKFSITCKSYSGGQSLTICLTSGNFEGILFLTTDNYNNEIPRTNENIIRGLSDRVKIPVIEQYSQLNQYTLKYDYDKQDGYSNGVILSKESWEVMQYAFKLASGFNFDDSDSMIDYFHTNFYLHLEIGKWNKPYMNTNKKEALKCQY